MITFLVALAAAAGPASAGVLTVQKSSPVGSSIGTVASNPAGISCGADCTEDYPSEEVCTPNPHVPGGEICNTVHQSVELTATGQSGFAIDSWTGCGSVSVDKKCTVVMSIDKTVTANFADVTNPTVFLTAPAAGPKRGTIELAATANDNWGVSRVEFLLSEALQGSDSGGPFQVSLDTSTKADGAYTVEARAVDFAGRTSTTATVSITIDNTAPEVTLGGPDGQTFGPGATQTWTIAASDETSGVASVQCSVQPSGSPPVFGPCSAGSSHSVTGLGDGEHEFAVRATDGAGNTTDETRQFTVDAIPPDTTITSGPEEGSSSTAPPATFGFTSTEAGSTFTCRLYRSGGAVPAFSPCSAAAGHGPVPQTAGTYVFEVVATDAYGNADASPARRTFTVLPPPDSGGAGGGGGGGGSGGGGAGDGAPRELKPSVARRWKLAGEMTEVGKLVVKKVASGVTVAVRCRGEGCPFRSKRLSAKGPSVALTKLFDSQLGPGSSIELQVTQPGYVGKFFRFVTRDGKAPKTLVRCLPPGSTKPVAC